MGRLLRYLARYRVRYLGGILCLIGATTLAMTVPWLWGRAIDAIAGNAPPPTLLRYGAYLIAIALVQGVVRTFSRFVIFNVGRDIEYDLRNDLFAHLERLPLGFYQRQQTGDLMSRLVNDVTAVRLLLGPGVLNIINTPVYYVYGLSIMLSMDWRLTLAALVAYPMAFGLVKWTSRHLMERSLRVQEGLAGLAACVQENLSGMHVVKAYDAAEQQERVFGALNVRFQEQNLRLARVRGFIGPIINIVNGSGALIVLWYGGRRVMAGHLTLGQLTAFIVYLQQLAWPTMALGWMLSVLQRGRAALQRLDELFNVAPAIASPPGAHAPSAVRGELTFRDVHFSYPTRRGVEVLRGVNLTIPAGATVAIVGRTGAGKSSLVQLVPRLFDVAAGQVLLDGQDVRTLPLDWLRRQIGLVPQDPFLFSRTLRENIAFALDADGTERVTWAAQAAALSRDVAMFPRGLETLVGERGITLSGGQKQRTTLARVLAVGPRILILDDALSSVDAQTERQILSQLRDFFRTRTTILVAHRVTTVREADLVVVLDDGRVVEVGDHESLVARGGLYAELFREQSLEGELEEIA